MKTILTLLFFFSFQLSYSQTSSAPRNYMIEVIKKPATEGEKLPIRVSTVSLNRDTLWLIDQQIGYLIASTWDNFPTTETKPVIIFTKILPEPRLVCVPLDKKKKRKKVANHKSGQASL
jgi:hypothetical protein